MHKLSTAEKISQQHGGFGIDILLPGQTLGDADSGLGTLGRIDHAHVRPGTLVPMHPHRDDEILTYLRRGRVQHRDSEGNFEPISAKRFMLMNAGSTFLHEEQVLAEGGELEGMQIFLRPEKSGLPPQVQFYAPGATFSLNQWRALAGPAASFPLHIRSQTWVSDARLAGGASLALPAPPVAGAISLLYVFEGEVKVNDHLHLTKGESLLLQNEAAQLVAGPPSDLVLLVTDPTSVYYDQGMYSGNQLRNQP
ncbi:pirin family protein [Hymenobacter sp. HD11105]